MLHADQAFLQFTEAKQGRIGHHGRRCLHTSMHVVIDADAKQKHGIDVVEDTVFNLLFSHPPDCW